MTELETEFKNKVYYNKLSKNEIKQLTVIGKIRYFLERCLEFPAGKLAVVIDITIYNATYDRNANNNNESINASKLSILEVMLAKIADSIISNLTIAFELNSEFGKLSIKTL